MQYINIFHNYYLTVEVHNMKGVRSDFIKTFKAKFSDENSYSLGFSFKYLDIPEDEQSVQVSLKIGNKEPLYYKGNFLSVADMRAKLNEVIVNINSLEDKDHKVISKIFMDDFKLLPSYHLAKKASARKLKMK